jgi:hypothetical protein
MSNFLPRTPAKWLRISHYSEVNSQSEQAKAEAKQEALINKEE